jgi:hypothetical protein
MGYSIGMGATVTAPQVGNSRYAELVKGQLALTAWRWGRDFGGHMSSLMIACCLRNRVTKGWGSWLSVIENIPKHGYTLAVPTGFPDQWNRDFLRILSEMDGIYDSTAKDLVNGGVYWAELSKIDNEYFLEHIARNPERKRCADMNNLVFWS